MRSIAFLLDDSNVQSADLSEPALGNPGVGGTEFNFVSLAHELAVRKLATVRLIHRNPTNSFPKTLSTIRIEQYPEGLCELLKQTGPLGCIVVRGHDTLPASGVIESLPQNIPLIAWTHNHLRSSTLSFLGAAKQVKRIVYVGREQCALAAGAASHFKSTYIFPGFYVEPRTRRKERRAVYIGSLVPQKGFHRLAKLWPRIRRAFPDAQLDVVGSSQVYHADQPLGPLGVAAPSYEKRLVRYLGKDPARHGVVFHGKLGREKYDVMSRALIGLPNPTGFTECCPASVVEMSQCGAAVVAFRQWGMCDTVLDGTTGYLCEDDREYVTRVSSLFSNPDIACSMGAAGQSFVQDTFSYGVICEKWERLFDEVASSAAPRYAVPSMQGKYPLHRLRVANNRWHSQWLHAVLNFVDRARGAFLKRY